MERFAVFHSGAFTVGTAQVKADTASFKVTAKFHGDLLFGGSGFVSAGIHRKGTVVDPFAHDLIVKGAFAVGAVKFGKISGDLGGTGDGDVPSAETPQHELDDTLDITQVQSGEFFSLRQQHRIKAGNGAVGTLKGNGDLQRTGSGSNQFAVLSVPENSGYELRIKLRLVQAINFHFSHDCHSLEKDLTGRRPIWDRS